MLMIKNSIRYTEHHMRHTRIYIEQKTKKFNNEKKCLRSIIELFSITVIFIFFFYRIPVVQFATLLFDLENNFIKII